MRGVGLKFTGYPKDIDQFKWVLAKEGCHPDAAERILKRIDTIGYDCLTVQDTLDFYWVRDNLSEIGVVMTFIKPLGGWTQKHENSEWPEEVLKKVFNTPKNKAITLDGNLAYKHLN